MALRYNDNMEVMAFDAVEDGRPIRRIRIKHAEVLGGGFRDFTGEKSDRGVLSLAISVPVDLLTVFANEGVGISHWTPADEDEDGIEQPGIVTLKINYKWRKQPKILVKVGDEGDLVEYSREDLPGLQHSIFSDANFVVNVQHGEYKRKPYTSLYIHQAWFTIKQDRLSTYEQEMLDEFGTV